MAAYPGAEKAGAQGQDKPALQSHGAFEKLLPDTIPLTEEQFRTFWEQTVLTEHSRRILDGLTAQNAATAPAQGVETAVRGNKTQPTAKTAHTAQEGGVDEGAAQG